MARFQTVPFNVTGSTYQSKSRPLSSQRTVNMYQQFNDKGKDTFVLHSFPGQKNINNTFEGNDRGMHQMKEVLYRVIDFDLYEVNKFGVHTLRGQVSGSNRCIFADDGESLVIVSDKIYVYNSFTDTFSENTNENIVGTISVTIINNQFIYTRPDFSFMSAAGDPFDVSGLDGIGAESSPDALVRDYAFNQTIYRFGKRTTEPWYNSDVGRPPIDRIDGQQFSVGLGAINSLTNTDNALYWLGDDKSVYRVSGGIKERISDDGLSNTIEEMDRFDDAFGYSFSLQGQDFYLITFPTGKRTFVVNESLGLNGWFELSSTTDDEVYSGTSLVYVYDKNMIAKGGQLLELCSDEFTQDTDTIIRERITTSINSDLLGIKGHEVLMSRLELIMEAGVGLITGQGVDPKIMIEASYDGGRSFAAGDWVDIGRAGQNTLRVEWFNMMTFTDLILKITMSDPVPLSIYSGAIDIKLVGR